MMEPGQQNRYQFGIFTLEANERRLLRNGRRVHLQPKAFQTLLVLVANRGHLVTKEELLESVWADSFVEENNLTKNIHTLRKALENDVGEYIETVPRVGYRFNPDIDPASHGGDIVIENVSNSRLFLKETYQEDMTTALPRRHLRTVVIGLTAVAIIGAFGIALMRANYRAEAAATAEASRRQAREAYAQGRALWQTRNAKDLHQATMMLERSIAIDPELAIAHAALADAYAFDFANWKKAEPQANEALRLDPTMGEAHAAIGFVRAFWEWDLNGAEYEFRKAIELRPDYATAHQWFAMTLAAGARKDAALSEIETAASLDLKSPSISADRCQILYFLHRYEDALGQCKRALDLDPGFLPAHANLYEIYSVTGMYQQAVDEYFTIKHLRGADPDESSDDERLRQAFTSGGIRQFWQLLTEQLERRGAPHYLLARYNARLGDRDKAIYWLKLAFEKHDPDFLLIASDPVFDDYHIGRNDLDFSSPIYRGR